MYPECESRWKGDTGTETLVGIFYEPGGVALTEMEYVELASLRGTVRDAYIEQVYTQPSRESSEENLRAQGLI